MQLTARTAICLRKYIQKKKVKLQKYTKKMARLFKEKAISFFSYRSNFSHWLYIKLIVSQKYTYMFSKTFSKCNFPSFGAPLLCTNAFHWVLDLVDRWCRFYFLLQWRAQWCNKTHTKLYLCPSRLAAVQAQRFLLARWRIRNALHLRFLPRLLTLPGYVATLFVWKCYCWLVCLCARIYFAQHGHGMFIV